MCILTKTHPSVSAHQSSSYRAGGGADSTTATVKNPALYAVSSALHAPATLTPNLPRLKLRLVVVVKAIPMLQRLLL